MTSMDDETLTLLCESNLWHDTSLEMPASTAISCEFNSQAQQQAASTARNSPFNLQRENPGPSNAQRENPSPFNSRRGDPGSNGWSPQQWLGRKWQTRKFYCLHKPNQNKKPSVDEIAALRDVGLWERSITMRINDDPHYFMSEVLKTFPPLADGGGFEVLHFARNSRRLIIIPIPDSGYTSTFLRDVVPSARLFLRPMQSDIALSKLKEHKIICSRSSDEAVLDQMDLSEEEQNVVLGNMRTISKIRNSNVSPQSTASEPSSTSPRVTARTGHVVQSSQVTNSSAEETRALDHIVQQFQRAVVDKEEEITITVNRKSIWKSAVRAFTRPTFNFSGALKIQFCGEESHDSESQKKQFFRLLLSEMATNSGLFIGDQQNLVFTHNVELLNKRRYELAGKIIALSLAQTGLAFNALNQTMYGLIFGTTLPDIDVYPSEQLMAFIHGVRSTYDETQFQELILANTELLSFNGCPPGQHIQLTDKRKIVKAMTDHFVYYRTHAEIEQFQLGLNTVGWLHSIITSNPRLFMSIYTFPKSVLNCEIFNQLFKVNWSEDSEKRLLEEDTMRDWHIFVQQVEGKGIIYNTVIEDDDDYADDDDQNDDEKCDSEYSDSTVELDCDERKMTDIPLTFEMLLTLLTGFGSIPVSGLDKQIDIIFQAQEKREGRIFTPLPSVVSSRLSLSLPRGRCNLTALMKLIVGRFFGM